MSSHSVTEWNALPAGMEILLPRVMRAGLRTPMRTPPKHFLTPFPRKPSHPQGGLATLEVEGGRAHPPCAATPFGAERKRARRQRARFLL